MKRLGKLPFNYFFISCEVRKAYLYLQKNNCGVMGIVRSNDFSSKFEAMTCNEFTQYIYSRLDKHAKRPPPMQHNHEILIVVKMIPNSSELNELDLSEILSRQLMYMYGFLQHHTTFMRYQMDNT